MSKYFIKPDLYIKFEDPKLKVDQRIAADITRASFEKVILPYLQKWSKTKAFKKLVSEWYSSSSSSIEFRNLLDLMKEKK